MKMFYVVSLMLALSGCNQGQNKAQSDAADAELKALKTELEQTKVEYLLKLSELEKANASLKEDALKHEHDLVDCKKALASKPAAVKPKAANKVEAQDKETETEELEKSVTGGSGSK